MHGLRNGALHSGMGLPTTTNLIKKSYTDMTTVQPDTENSLMRLISQVILCIKFDD